MLRPDGRYLLFIYLTLNKHAMLYNVTVLSICLSARAVSLNKNGSFPSPTFWYFGIGRCCRVYLVYCLILEGMFIMVYFLQEHNCRFHKPFRTSHYITIKNKSSRALLDESFLVFTDLFNFQFLVLLWKRSGNGDEWRVKDERKQ